MSSNLLTTSKLYNCIQL